MHIDASAALAITQRQGLGKLRHIAAHWLWIQEKVETGQIKTKKALGRDSLADLFAEHLPSDDVRKRFAERGFHSESGRANKPFAINVVHDNFNNVDQWTTGDQCVVRVHNEPRRCFYEPFQESGAPKMSDLTSIRSIHGGCLDNGETVVRHDNWNCKSTNRLDLGRPCV